jgi:hypothetical protein
MWKALRLVQLCPLSSCTTARGTVPHPQVQVCFGPQLVQVPGTRGRDRQAVEQRARNEFHFGSPAQAGRALALRCCVISSKRHAQSYSYVPRTPAPVGLRMQLGDKSRRTASHFFTHRRRMCTCGLQQRLFGQCAVPSAARAPANESRRSLNRSAPKRAVHPALLPRCCKD